MNFPDLNMSWNNTHTNPPSPPRVLILPLPMQGHVSAMLKLADLLALSGLHVTFMTTEHVHSRLLGHGQSDHLLAYAGFQFRTFPDGLPENHPRSADRMGDLFASVFATVKPLLKQMLVSEEDPTCLIADGIFGSFPIEIGRELGIPVIHFRTGSACYLWACFCIPDIIQAGELPSRGDEDRDRAIRSVGGMESFLRCRDLPSFAADGTHHFVVAAALSGVGAHGLILNTFQDLEGPILDHVRARYNPKTYALGPLHAHLRHRQSSATSASASLFPVDSACMAWLDSQPPNSVIHVSFGSLVSMTRDKLIELWHGLVNSKNRFLLVLRSDLLNASGEGDQGLQVPRELAEATEERGFVAGWVPQEEVLSHPAVGGFLTHSGWNSTLESIVAGVPMICLPSFGDQQVNSRFVGEVCKLGIDMKDVWDRNVVEKMVHDLMVERRDQFARSTAEMARLANKSVTPGGSSYFDLDRLIQDLWAMKSK